MGKIHMEPGLVRDLSSRMERTAGELYNQGRRLDQAAARLPHAWQGGRSASHQRDFRNFLRSYHAAVEELQNLSVRVGREVDQWQIADDGNAFAQNGVTARPADDWLHDLSLDFEHAWDQWENINDLKDLGETFVVIGGMTAGSTYVGQVIVRGKQSFKDAAGLSKHLTHINAANLPKHLIKQNKVKGAEIVSGAIDFGFDAYEDWNSHPDGSEKAAALMYDFTWNAGAVYGKVAITNWVAGALLVPTAAAAVAAGAPVILVGGGVLLAWWGVSYATGEVFELAGDFLETSGFKEAVVRAGGEALDTAAGTAVDLARGAEAALNTAVDGAASAAKSAAKAVDGAFDSVVSGVSSWF